MANTMKNADVQAVQISIDGAKLETHDSFRGEYSYVLWDSFRHSVNSGPKGENA